MRDDLAQGWFRALRHNPAKLWMLTEQFQVFKQRQADLAARAISPNATVAVPEYVRRRIRGTLCPASVRRSG